MRLLAQQAMDVCMQTLPVGGCCLEPLLQRCAAEAEAAEGEAASLQVQSLANTPPSGDRPFILC